MNIGGLEQARSQLNKAKFINALNSPNMSRYYVGALVGVNAFARITADLLDKKEKPQARRYQAFTEGLHGAFCLATQFVIAPLFAIGGIVIGKRALAKGAYKELGKQIDNQQIKNLIVPEQINKKAKKAEGQIIKKFKKVKEVIGNFIEKLPPVKAYKESDTYKLRKGIDYQNKYNGRVLHNIREALFGNKTRTIVMKTVNGLMEVTDKGNNHIVDILESLKFKNTERVKWSELTTKQQNYYKRTAEDLGNAGLIKEIDNFEDAEIITRKGLDYFENNGFIKKFTGDEVKAKMLHDKGDVLLTDGTVKLGNSKKNHNNIIGSEKVGDAIGMMLALTVISPLFTNAFVPFFQKLFGLEGKGHGNDECSEDSKKNSTKSQFNQDNAKHKEQMNMNNFLNATKKGI